MVSGVGEREGAEGQEVQDASTEGDNAASVVTSELCHQEHYRVILNYCRGLRL
jgi:hypothetical protein